MEKKEVEILSGIRRGDSNSFDLLFDNYYDNLCNYVASIIHKDDIAEDIVQELFANMWVNRKKIAIRLSFKSYLFRSAYNASLDYLKHLKIENQYQSGIPENFPPSFNNSMEFMELLESLGKSIEQLPDNCKMIFKLSRFENLKYREIAQKLSISENTVDTQIRRALKKLREDLKDYLVAFFIILKLFF